MIINIKYLKLWILRGEVLCGWISMSCFSCVSFYWIVREA